MAKRKNKVNHYVINFLLFLLLITGVLIMLYPFISNWYNQRIQNQLITQYEYTANQMSDEEIENELLSCQEYNQKLLKNVILRDPFDVEAERMIVEEYKNHLNINNDGIMGYLEIPKIDVKLAIYHGTDTKTLDKGVGHLENTSLPVGGTATHAVLSAHTAYAKATLFDNLVDLEIGDIFNIIVLGDTLVYQVDQIKIVEPSNTSYLSIDNNQDYVTLVTCTPYGVNSHRLLVRGTRIANTEPIAQTKDRSWILPFLIFLSFIILFFIILLLLLKRKIVDEKKYIRNHSMN